MKSLTKLFRLCKWEVVFWLFLLDAQSHFGPQVQTPVVLHLHDWIDTCIVYFTSTFCHEQ